MSATNPPRLGAWVLEERIGSGGLAEVWRASPPDGGRKVALKILREPDRSRAHRNRFLREGRLLRRLAHAGLPRCFDVVENPRPYLVLELLEGQTLSQRVKRHGAMPPDDVVATASALLRVLDYLHHYGIVHRDVKASNVYLTHSNRVLLLDLGLAADPADPLTTTLGDVMGTYAYMAPEQIAGAEVDHRCDLYSLGITLYEALAQSRPFHASGATGYLRAHRRGKTTPLSELVPNAPVRLLDTITRLMARDPAARPPSSGVALAHLTGAAGADRRLRAAPLVGRGAALGAIHAVLDEGGRSILQGEIGAGSGRVAAEAITLARAASHELIALRCRHRALPQDVLGRLLEDLGRVTGRTLESPAELGTELEALSEEGPTLLILEDAELLGSEAAEILARALLAAPALRLIATSSRPVPQLPAHMVTLRPLRLEETHQVVAGMLRTVSPPAGLAEQLHRMSGGLPGIVVLGIKELVRRKALACKGIGDDGTLRWHLDRSAPIAPTTGLSRLFGTVLASADRSSRRLLDLLAVAGSDLPLEMAMQVAGLDDGGSALGNLTMNGLVRREIRPGADGTHGEWIALRRPAVGTLVLAEVSSSRQATLHRLLAKAMAAMPESPWRDRRLTWHRAFGARPDEAPTALLALGQVLHRGGEPQRALDVLAAASRIPGTAPAVSAELAIARGLVLDTVAQREKAATALKAGRRLAEELGLRSLQARAMVGLGRVHHGMGDERRTALIAEDVFTLLGEDTNDPSLPAALLLSANSHRLGARPEEAAVTYKRCVEVARRQGNLSYAARAHGGLGALLAEEGQLAEAVRHFSEEATFLRGDHRHHDLVPTLYRLAICKRRQGQPDAAVEALDEAKVVARRAGLPYAQALAEVGLASVALACGDLEQTQRQLDSSRIALDAEATTYLRLAHREISARFRLSVDDPQAALAAFQAAEMEANRAGFTASAAYYLGMVGVLTADPDALMEAMHVLSLAGDRGLAAQLLFYGATVGGDAEVLASTERETRASGDRFLLLDVLHASRGARARAEANDIATKILGHTPANLRPAFLALRAVRWADPDT